MIIIDEHQGCRCKRDNEDLFKFMSFVDFGFYDHNQRTCCTQCTTSAPPTHTFVGSTLRVVYPPEGTKPKIYLRVPFVLDLEPTSSHYLPVSYNNNADSNNIGRRLEKLEKFYSA